MARYRLKHDVSIMFNGGGAARDGYPVTAKAGEPVKMIPDGMGKPCYALMTGTVAREFSGLYKHDGYYYYVWTPADTVEEVPPVSRCPRCGAGPIGNCGYYGCETPRETCPLLPQNTV